MIQGIFHVNINATNFERSLAFYKTLGFRVALDLGEKALSPELAEGLRLPDGVARSAIMMVGKDPGATRIALVEWKNPKTAGRSYSDITHAGVPRLALRTTDLPQVYADLRAQGVAFLSEPQDLNLAGGERMVCLTDPDGLAIELIEIL